jgi:hypothetical protein
MMFKIILFGLLSCSMLLDASQSAVVQQKAGQAKSHKFTLVCSASCVKRLIRIKISLMDNEKRHGKKVSISGVAAKRPQDWKMLESERYSKDCSQEDKVRLGSVLRESIKKLWGDSFIDILGKTLASFYRQSKKSYSFRETESFD